MYPIDGPHLDLMNQKKVENNVLSFISPKLDFIDLIFFSKSFHINEKQLPEKKIIIYNNTETIKDIPNFILVTEPNEFQRKSYQEENR